MLESSGPDYDIEIDGIRLRCHLGDNSTDSSVLARGFGQRGLTLLGQLLRAGDVFVDVGANCGVFTLLAVSRVGSAGRVIAIEPNPAMLSRLRFNLAANGLSDVRVVEAAISDTDGVAELRLSADNAGESTLSDALSRSTAWSVPTMTLASVVAAASIPRIDVLKIDIEGFEDRALVPYISAVPPAMWPTHVLLEFSHSDRWKQDCTAVLQDKGYKHIWNDKSDVLLKLARSH